MAKRESSSADPVEGFDAARYVHYAYSYTSSMGMHLSGTSCGISASFFEVQNCQYRSAEDAMKRKPGNKGWWSDEPAHVDCPFCTLKMHESLRAALTEAEKALAYAEENLSKVAGKYRVAMQKAGLKP